MGLVRLERLSILMLGTNLEANRKTPAGFLSPGFWAAVPLFRSTKWALCALLHAVKYLGKDGIKLLCYLRFSWEKGEFLSALPIPDHAMPPLDCRNGLFLQQHWSKQQQQQLSVGNCSVAFGQGGSSAKPGPADGSQPQPGVGGTGRGPRPCHAWKRGSLELNLAVLHFPREQDEERQFLCWPSCMINGEFKHSIGLLCNLAVLLMFSGKVCFSPMKCGAEFSQQHRLKWLEASVFEFSR